MTRGYGKDLSLLALLSTTAIEADPHLNIVRGEDQNGIQCELPSSFAIAGRASPSFHWQDIKKCAYTSRGPG